MPATNPSDKRKPARTRQRDQGAVLLVVMMVMMGLLGLGMTALWLTTGNMRVGANVNLRANALYVAEAGIERAREYLNDPANAPDVTDLLDGCGLGFSLSNCTASPAPADDVPNQVDVDTGAPNGVGAIMYEGAGLLLEGIPYPPVNFVRDEGTQGAPVLSASMGTYTVWVRNDIAELRQGLFTADTNNTIVVRSQGVASDGRTTVVLEVTLGPSPAEGADPNAPGPPPPVLCNSGKNACDDNSSTQYGIVVN